MLFIGKYNEERAVGRLSEIVALGCGVNSGKARQIRIAAALHDVGKLKIPESILLKPGELDAQEFEIIKTHTVLGVETLASVQGELGVMARACCEWHHEWHNGGGYWGRRMGDLPFYLPFVAISDVFTALISERPYKQAWPPHKAVDYIQKQAGTQFSPELVTTFLSLIRSDERVAAIFYGG